MVINHTRGHVIPPLPQPDVQRLRSFLVQQLQEAAAVAAAGVPAATAAAAAGRQEASRL